MDLEINELRLNNTWILVPRPQNKLVITGRWVYKTKQNADGSIAKYKARYVAKGYLQQFGINFYDTFAGTLRSTSYRILLTLALRANWIILQWDVISAFPQADLDTEIYMEQPLGYKILGDQVCLLKKALYGLKQSNRQWLLKITSLLTKQGFKPITADPAVFIHKDKPIIIGVYVDDLLVFTKNIDLARSIY